MILPNHARQPLLGKKSIRVPLERFLTSELAADHPAAGNVDGPLLHPVNPGQALAAAIGGAGIRIVCQNAGNAGALNE